MGTEAQRVPLAQVSDLLAPGRPLPFKVLDAEGRLLLAAGQCIADGRQLAALIERGASVEYAEVEATRRALAKSAGGATGPGSQRDRTLFDRWDEKVGSLDGLLRMLGRDKGMIGEVEACAADHIELVDHEPDAALFIAVRQDEHRLALYSLTHAMNTATVVLLAARMLGWPAPQAQRAVLAALMMNASIVELQAQMAEQSDPPTKKQLDEIRAHPRRSAEMLRASGMTDEATLNAVEDHHERADGTGYPRALAEVGELARLVRAADVFMAKISPRALRAPLRPQVAAQQLFQGGAGGPVAGALIKAIGVYPPGDFVRLRNGDAAIVVRRAAAGAATQVMSVQDARGKPMPAAPRRDTAQPEFNISGPLVERTTMPRVLPEQVYGLVPA